ncbi:hypothetical protein [Pseudobutyrivibrio ruminis]|uniref:Antitoxin n=1 Tax=Pseudobutyrivibrio ruminis TaxID=46206 RepID=A0A2G3DTD4_9FIRM|nr:hypothetical protein [Pseudobutyrivibrio ruminis]PHU34278.1 hypothetical protein CSX01_10690 [Pseudobutyrivibrio ruminis]
MFEHSFRVVKTGTFEELVMDFKDNKYELLSVFLESEVSNFGDWIKDTIEKVLSGEEEKQIIGGNCCVLEINRDTTKIYDSLAEDGMGNWCELSTRELRDLIDYWCEKEREFKRKQNI